MRTKGQNHAFLCDFNRYLYQSVQCHLKEQGKRLHTPEALKKKTVKESNCVPPYLDVLRDLVSALLMTSEGADCRL